MFIFTLIRYFLVIFIFFNTNILSFGSTGLSYTLDNTLPGTRARAMGSSFVALADDPSAIFYNPAGITYIKKSYLSLAFDYFPQNNYGSSLSFIHTPKEGEKWAFGTALRASFNIDSNRYSEDGSASSDMFMPYNGALFFSLARKIGDDDKYSVGFNLKAIHRSVDDNKSYGFGLDFGFKASLYLIDFGLFISDIVTFETFSLDSKTIYYDRILKLSIASNFLSGFMLSFQIDKNLSTTDDVIFRVGGYVKLWDETWTNGADDKDTSLARANNNKKTNDEKKQKKQIEENLKEELDFDEDLPSALYLNFGYGNKRIGVGLTLRTKILAFDISASFRTLSIDNTSFLFSLNIPLY